MSSLRFFFLAALALSIAQAADWKSADVQDECENQFQDETFVVQLENVDNTVTHSRVCYDPVRSSVVELSCDWKNLEFNVFVNTTRYSDDQRSIKYTPPITGRMAQGLRQVARGHAKPNCHTWGQSHEIDQRIPFRQSKGNPPPQRELTIDKDGKLYYKTTVYLSENLWTDDCEWVSPKDVTIHLSCCADIPPVEVKVIVMLLIFRGNCSINSCENTHGGECGCLIKDNHMHVNVSYLKPLPAGYSYQVTSVSALPGSSGINPVGVSIFSPNGPTPSGLNLEQCQTMVSSPNPVQHYAMHDIGFSANPRAPVHLECQVEICVLDKKDANQFYPVCRPQPALPEPKECTI